MNKYNFNIDIEDSSNKLSKSNISAITQEKAYAQTLTVDLGLPSGNLWAIANLGATLPEEAGNHYSWGELTPIESYSSNSYIMDKVSDLTFYNKEKETEDLSKKYDVAYKTLGTKWRIPSVEDFEELNEYTTHRWKYYNKTISGILFKSKSNDNELFLPVVGYYRDSYGEVLVDYKLSGLYWSRNRYITNRRDAYVFQIENYADVGKIMARPLFWGIPIRPIYLNK